MHRYKLASIVWLVDPRAELRLSVHPDPVRDAFIWYRNYVYLIGAIEDFLAPIPTVPNYIITNYVFPYAPHVLGAIIDPPKIERGANIDVILEYVDKLPHNAAGVGSSAMFPDYYPWLSLTIKFEERLRRIRAINCPVLDVPLQYWFGDAPFI